MRSTFHLSLQAIYHWIASVSTLFTFLSTKRKYVIANNYLIIIISLGTLLISNKKMWPLIDMYSVIFKYIYMSRYFILNNIILFCLKQFYIELCVSINIIYNNEHVGRIETTVLLYKYSGVHCINQKL